MERLTERDEERMSKVLPILFNTEMVQAILNGRKTCIRRIIKPQPKMKLSFCLAKRNYDKWSYPPKSAWEIWGEEYRHTKNITEEDIKKIWNPPYHADDILYIREIRQECRRNICKRTPSIHMPKEAARIWLKVTDVQVERLQDITTEQVVKEGVKPPHYNGYLSELYGIWIEKVKKYVENENPQFVYSQLWDSTIKKSDLDLYGWDANPWVWVIEFEQCEKPFGGQKMNSRRAANFITEIIRQNYSEIVEARETDNWDELEHEILEMLKCMD